jgi:hypothetical protein
LVNVKTGISLKTPIDRSMSRVSLSFPSHSTLSYWMRRADDEGPICESEAGADVPPTTLGVGDVLFRTHCELSRFWTGVKNTVHPPKDVTDSSVPDNRSHRNLQEGWVSESAWL